MRGGYEYGKNPDQSAPKTTIATHNSNISLWLHQTVEYSAPDDVENPLDLEISHDSSRANFVGDSFPHVLTASVRGSPKCNISHLHFHVSFSRPFRVANLTLSGHGETEVSCTYVRGKNNVGLNAM